MATARYSDTAKADLADIFGYVAEHDSTAADDCGDL
jgi:plasmid stabilization system protein ParE